MTKKRIGEILFEKKAITASQLSQALAIQKQTRQRLGVILVEKNIITEEQLVQVLSETTGIPIVKLDAEAPDWSAVHTLRARLCETHTLFPYALENPEGRHKKRLFVAMGDPLNQAAVQEIEFTTGLTVTARLATLSSIRTAILRYYHKVNPDDAGSGKMTLIQRGGTSRIISTETHEEDDAPIVEGEEISAGATGKRELLNLIDQRAAQSARKKAPSKVANDLDFLFGSSHSDEAFDKLERKFWALMRIMARKGLITKDEFSQELDDGEH